MCECGHDQDLHATMRDHIGPCMRCRCSHFTVANEDDHLDGMADVSEADLARMREDLMRTVADLS